MLFLLLTLPAVAQYENYDLKTYSHPDYTRKSLDIDMNSAGKFYRNDDANSQNLSGLFSYSYNNIRMSRKVQDNTNMGVIGNIKRMKLDSVSYQKSRMYDVGVFYNQKAHYYIDRLRFIEISPRAVLGYNNTKNNTPSTDNFDQRKKNFSHEVEIDIGFGKGRIENVTDARQAIYILEDLSEKKILKRQLSTNEINELAQEMAITKNKRHFDARQKAIDELTHINDFLIAKGYIDTVNTADYFLSLSDYWENGDLEPRNAGRRVKIGVAPTFIFKQNSVSYEKSHLPKEKSTDTKWGGTLYFDYTNENPLNLKWQRYINVGLRSGLYRWRSAARNQFLSHAYGEFGVGYFVDTRTYIEGLIHQSLYWGFTPSKGESGKENTLESYTTLAIKGYYYISSRVKLHGEYNLSYSFFRRMESNQNLKDRYPRSSFQLGITLSIF